jgi:phosphoserine phosphatase
MRGELDFAGSLTRRVALLAGLPTSVLDEVRSRITVTDGVPELFAAVHAVGGAVGAVSGGFGQVLGPLAAELGLDRSSANELEIVEGLLTGRVRGRIVDAEVKRERLLDWADELGASRTIAIGDGANDVLMMTAADLSVGFDAKPAVRAVADICLPGRSLRPLLALL